jgi:hypothetical protein
VARLDKLAQQRFRKHVIHLAIRWMLDQGITRCGVHATPASCSRSAR